MRDKKRNYRKRKRSREKYTEKKRKNRWGQVLIVFFF